MINLGLTRTQRLLSHVAKSYLNQPHFIPPWKAAHIAGTNGKGSVAANLAALLRRSRKQDGQPLRVGRFTSPHFIDRWDCIWIDGQPVERDVFLQAEGQVKSIVGTVEEELRNEALVVGSNLVQNPSSQDALAREARLTEFEILTATAFLLFSLSTPRPCDVAVVECGLGGRLDATNVLPDDAISVSIITRIGLDHLDMLGGSLRGIVKEKCGIFRPGVPVVVDGDNEAEVLEMVRGHFKNKNPSLNEGSALSAVKGADVDALLGLLNRNMPTNNPKSLPTTRAEKTPTTPISPTTMPHQRSNMAVALQAFTILQQKLSLQFEFASTAASQTLQKITADASKSYPARLQWLRPGWLDQTPGDNRLPRLNQTPVLLDGAHNAQSVAVLREYVDLVAGLDTTSSVTRRPEIWILALSSSKPPAEILKTLFARFQDGKESQAMVKIIFTSFGGVDGMPWVKALPPSELVTRAEALSLTPMVEGATKSVVEALDVVESMLLRSDPGEMPLIVISGSLYLASDFLRFARDGRLAFLEHLKSAPPP